MKHRKSQHIVSDLAKQAGAGPRPSWPRRIFRAAVQKWKSRKTVPAGLIIFAGEDAPRDPDDPLSDPKVQARLGEAIAKWAKRRRG